MNITIDYNYVAIFIMNLLYFYIAVRTVMFLLWFIMEIIFRDEEDYIRWNNAPFIWNIIRLYKEGKEKHIKEKQEEEEYKLREKQHQDEYQAKMNKVIEQRIAEYEKSKKVDK